MTPSDDEPDRPAWDLPGERFDHLGEAAIEAELETGRREETVREAKRHVLVRLAVVVAGSVVCLFGIALLVLPGPGLLVLLAGLVMLSSEVPFAARLVDRVRARLPQDADGKLPTSTIVMMVVVAVFFVAASTWFTFLR